MSGGAGVCVGDWSSIEAREDGMTTSNNERREEDAGSRMHVLDWLKSSQFFPTLRELVTPIGFAIAENTERQPKGRNDHRESVLVGKKEPFLSRDQQDRLQDWWLVYKDGAKLPTWDLVVAASDASHHPALVLVEAKAHGTELRESGKDRSRRKTSEQQARTDFQPQENRAGYLGGNSCFAADRSRTFAEP